MGKRIGRPPKRRLSEETREKMSLAHKKRNELKRKEAEEEIKRTFDNTRDIREQLWEYLNPLS